MVGRGRKKEQRRAKQEEKRAAKKDNNQAGTSSSSSSGNATIILPADEWFAKFTEDVLDQPGNPMDVVMRNMIRLTAEIRTGDFGALRSLLGKNLVWFQLALIDEKRCVQGKIHGIGAKVLPNDPNVAEISRSLFRETAPLLLRDTECWIFSRFMVLKEYNGLIDEALKFHAHDPLGGLDELRGDTTLGTRCTEVFMFIAGDFAVEDGSLNSCEAIQKFVHELNSPEGAAKLHGFDVVAGSAKVSKHKLAALKLFQNMNLTA